MVDIDLDFLNIDDPNWEEKWYEAINKLLPEIPENEEVPKREERGISPWDIGFPSDLEIDHFSIW